MDGVAKNFSQSANLWSIMRGNAAEHATPTVRAARRRSLLPPARPAAVTLLGPALWCCLARLRPRFPLSPEFWCMSSSHVLCTYECAVPSCGYSIIGPSSMPSTAPALFPFRPTLLPAPPPFTPGGRGHPITGDA
jgi:hypothetical protein